MNEPPSFIVIPDSKEVIASDKVKFSCKVRGKPLPEITWFKEENTIMGDDDITIETKERTNKLEVESLLCIKSALLNDESDLYRIEAENSIGNVVHDFGLTGEQP